LRDSAGISPDFADTASPQSWTAAAQTYVPEKHGVKYEIPDGSHAQATGADTPGGEGEATRPLAGTTSEYGSCMQLPRTRQHYELKFPGAQASPADVGLTSVLLSGCSYLSLRGEPGHDRVILADLADSARAAG
jgi:hypothetical protein